MIELWYAIVALLLAGYVVLDGFDLGAGALHLFVAKNDGERRTVLAAIGPFWDGNEVCLLAAGGALFVAFPTALAAGLSGFSFAIFLVIWTLLLRGIAIEFRSHVTNVLWRAAWDLVFCVASLLLPVLFGAALGNLVRGVPIDERGWFELTLFTDFTPRVPVGILDWYTVVAGVFALVALLAHGAAFLAWKAGEPVRGRARALVRPLYASVIVLWPLVTAATQAVNPDLLAALPHRPVAWIALLVALGGIVAVFRGTKRERPLAAFLGSCAFLAGMLAATAACLYPSILHAIPTVERSITAENASAAPHSLAVALCWFSIGFPLAVAWFVIVFRLHRGRAVAANEGEGY